MTLIIIIFYYIIIPLIIGLIARFIYLICNRGAVMKNNIQCAKTMIVLGSGGHTTEMFKILNNLDVNKYKPRIYVLGHTDKMSESKINEFESCNNDYRVIKIYRSRQVGQSYLSSIVTTLIAFLNAFVIIFNEKPDLILSNGPGTCVPLCLVAFILKLFYLNNTIVIFVESFCRVKSLSLTGKILYFFADHVILQWPFICKQNSHVHVVN
ncbi:UDP-N-acetylglucosamine transferase subunit ALG14 homolog [Microplitis demolitor]|uniref:UDP-N-acetylglucosamine transferase subunit ALG14 homolog n=1 Tax=Microplitis demolitor TaxID=69319 RepID=UPI0006D4D123|nr:UDP-N-acetylglucosamine transferase subunit ALG14 homolog [Microplitis demolitor]